MKFNIKYRKIKKIGVVIIRTVKKIAMLFRTITKILVLTIISIFLISGAVAFFYKPTYAVSLNGELVGYTENKTELQNKINQYMEGESEEGIAFRQIDSVPEYKLCLLKKDYELNDDEIYQEVTKNGTQYYKYYVIAEDKKEKFYVETFEEAEQVVKKLKEKDSTNKDKISIVEKYDVETKKFTSVNECVSKLYKEKTKVVATTTTTTTNTTRAYSGNVSGTSSQKVNIGINLIKPVSGIITSRFGSRESIRSSAHRGLDIATSTGTPFKAAASGTVASAGYSGSYGNMILISHGNGVQTLYAHCSQLNVSTGEKVSQGQIIGKVGTTGNVTGPHLHFEVRKNGVILNPQNYVY